MTAAIGRLSGEKTVLCIAHRVSTIRYADQIYVVEGGRIAASGTYDELVKTSQLFRTLAADRNGLES